MKQEQVSQQTDSQAHTTEGWLPEGQGEEEGEGATGGQIYGERRRRDFGW